VAEARGGEDFAALARAHSAAPSAKAGGDLGRLARGELHPDLEKAAFALAAGDVSEPVRSGDGYRILKVEARTEASVVPFEEVKESIRRSLYEKRMSKELASYIAGLREKAIINVMVREVPQQLEGDAVSAPSTLREPQPPTEGAAAPADDAEIVTSPQDRPEEVKPSAPPPPQAP
jgi:hypothetical protein